MILEDNPYGELRFSGGDVPTIKSMDTEGLVIYTSSFSKILSAGMRVGFVIAPEAVASKMVVAKQSEDVHTNLFFQMLCYRYMTECDLDAHIASIRALYRHKCGLMLDALDAAMRHLYAPGRRTVYLGDLAGVCGYACIPEGDRRGRTAGCTRCHLRL